MRRRCGRSIIRSRVDSMSRWIPFDPAHLRARLRRRRRRAREADRADRAPLRRVPDHRGRHPGPDRQEVTGRTGRAWSGAAVAPADPTITPRYAELATPGDLVVCFKSASSEWSEDARSLHRLAWRPPVHAVAKRDSVVTGRSMSLPIAGRIGLSTEDAPGTPDSRSGETVRSLRSRPPDRSTKLLQRANDLPGRLGGDLDVRGGGRGSSFHMLGLETPAKDGHTPRKERTCNAS